MEPELEPVCQNCCRLCSVNAAVPCTARHCEPSDCPICLHRRVLRKLLLGILWLGATLIITLAFAIRLEVI